MNDIRVLLFEAMRNDIGVMLEHSDNEQSLLNEIMTADNDIIQAYKEIFLN